MRRVLRILGTLLIVAGLGTVAWAGLVWQWQDPFTALYTHFQQNRLASSYERRFAAYHPHTSSRPLAAARREAAAQEQSVDEHGCQHGHCEHGELPLRAGCAEVQLPCRVRGDDGEGDQDRVDRQKLGDEGRSAHVGVQTPYRRPCGRPIPLVSSSRRSGP